MNRPDFIRAIFSRFRDLNLITLIQNLRQSRVARGSWLNDGRLCPLAHGLPSGQVVELVCGGDAIESILGVDYASSEAFLSAWDNGRLSDVELLTDLTMLWRERRSDADAVQGVLTAPELSMV